VASIVAVNVDTGVLKWHYQMVPGDEWDYDSVQQMVLADLNINGKTRKVIMQANKNGSTASQASSSPLSPSPESPGQRGSIKRRDGPSLTRK